MQVEDSVTIEADLSGLLDQEQLKAAYRAVPRDQRETPQTVAEQLVKMGKLSRFQADKLLAGTAMGLVVGQSAGMPFFPSVSRAHVFP